MGKKTKKTIGGRPSAQTLSRLAEALAAIEAGRPPGEAAAALAGLGLEEAAELARALGLAASAPAAELAAALVQASGAREARRAFKRALYLLERKGFRATPAPVEPVLKGPEPPRLPAYVSLPDPAGEQMVIAAVPGRGGWDVCLGSVSERGVEHFMVVQVARKGIKPLAATVEEDSKLPLVETEAAHARYLLEEAQAASTLRGGEGLTPEFTPFLKGLAAFTGTLASPPVYGLLDAAEVEGDPALLEGSPRLLEGIGVLWLLPAEEVRPYVLEIEGAETSGLVLSREQRQERLLAIFQKAARELFDERRRRAWRRRLEESAFVLARRGKREEAGMALAAALDLGREPSELRVSPLALALVGRSLAPLLAEAAGQREEESLIIKPGEPR